jgi:hypothetical protein
MTDNKLQVIPIGGLGARVIYYCHNERLPVFLLSAYAKSRKANLSQAERSAMRRLAMTLVKGYPRPRACCWL